MQDFRHLAVWRKAYELTLAVYRSTRHFPPEELHGLRAQLRRSAASVAMNIAEGCARDGDKEFARFLHFAIGSASELECQLLLVRDLLLIDRELHQELQKQTTEVKKMLSSLLRKLRAES